MQFKERKVEDLYIEVEVAGPFGRYEDSNYFWFKQTGNLWDPVERVDNFLRKARGVGLLKRTYLEVLVESTDNVRSLDKFVINSVIGVDYQVKNPTSLVYAYKNLGARLQSAFRNFLVTQVKNISADKLGDSNDELIDKANGSLNKALKDIGLTLTIQHLEIAAPDFDQIAGSVAETRMEISGEILLDPLRQQLATSRFKGQLEMRVFEMLELAQASSNVRRIEMDTMIDEVQRLIPGSDPILSIMYILSQKDTAAAQQMNEMFKIQGEVQKMQLEQDILVSYLNSKNPKGGNFLPSTMGSSAKDSLRQLPISTDPMESAVRNRFPDLNSYAVTPSSRNGRRYRLDFPDLCIDVNCRDGRVQNVLYGTRLPTTPWYTHFPETDSPNDVVALIQTIRNRK